jgi:PEGA domain-containing protein
MFRVRHALVIASLSVAPVLTGCSGSSLSTYLPDWLQPKPAAPPTQALQFESQPPGADARTEQGQTCLTPCSLAVPITNQSVTFVLNGYVSQTAQVEVTQAGDLSPNPLMVALAPIAPPPRPVAKPRKKPRPKPVARTAPAQQPAIVAPEQAPGSVPPSASPFPPPPPPSR